MKQLLKPEGVKRSIYEALYLNRDCSESIHRIRGVIANYPAGKLYYRSEKSLIRFYLSYNCTESFLSKSSDLLYSMCRKRYLLLLLHALELRDLLLSPETECRRTVSCIMREFDKAVDRIMKLLDVYIRGNLDIARIVLTPKQYRWLSGNYPKKKFVSDKTYTTDYLETIVRSKSECDLGNDYEDYAVPYHYEERIILNAGKIVQRFEQELLDSGVPGPICYMKDWTCCWNVPAEFEYMNMHGSLWRAYRPNTGKITIFNDFHVMVADGDIIAHEHEGYVEDFKYRSNASERVYVMRLTGAVNEHNLITTFEEDVRNFKDVIRDKILPRLWF